MNRQLKEQAICSIAQCSMLVICFVFLLLAVTWVKHCKKLRSEWKINSTDLVLEKLRRKMEVWKKRQEAVSFFLNQNYLNGLIKSRKCMQIQFGICKCKEDALASLHFVCSLLSNFSTVCLLFPVQGIHCQFYFSNFFHMQFMTMMMVA